MRKLLKRSYNYGQDENVVILEIYEPYLSDGNWTCEYEISYPAEGKKFSVRGVDKLQALSLTLKKISVDFEYHNDMSDDKITWMGDDRLDLI